MTTLRIYIFIFIVTIFPRQTFGQNDNFVQDKELNDDLYEFLITKITDYTKDSLGKKVPATFSYVKGKIYITTRNLKTDSILQDKTFVGLYATRFACLDCGSELELYFQHRNRREYLTIDEKNLLPFELIKKIQLFFELYPKEFTEIEKIRTLRGALEVLEARDINPYNDW